MATIVKKCLICGEVVVNTEQHRRVHSKPDDRICDVCGKTFTKTAWGSHMKQHRDEKQGKCHCCPLCSKSFLTTKVLKHHMAVHTTKRPYVCEICGKAFKLQKVLDKHKKTHSSHKAFMSLTCKFCGKRFTDNYNLKGHLRTHTGEKPFQCDICNTAFTHNVSLKTHKKSAHGIDMWKDQKKSVMIDMGNEKEHRDKQQVTKGNKSTHPDSVEHGSTEQASTVTSQSSLIAPSMHFAHDNPYRSLISDIHQPHIVTQNNPRSLEHDSVFQRDPHHWAHVEANGRSFTKL